MREGDPRVAASLALPPPPPPNVLLVTIDTLRADRVGAYGYAGAATPTLDRLAREGVLLEDAVVQVPQTRPSHASILTGRYPYEHGLRDNYSPPLDRQVHATLATLLSGQGYDTAAFIGAYPVSRPSGLDQGFDVYDDPFGAGESSTTRDPRLERTARRGGGAAPWPGSSGRAARPSSPGSTSSTRTLPTSRRRPSQTRFAESPYDGEVAFADAAARPPPGLARPRGPAGQHAGGGHLRPRRGPGRPR